MTMSSSTQEKRRAASTARARLSVPMDRAVVIGRSTPITQTSGYGQKFHDITSPLAPIHFCFIPASGTTPEHARDGRQIVGVGFKR